MHTQLVAVPFDKSSNTERANMIKALTFGELTSRIREYVGYETLTPELQALADEQINSVLETQNSGFRQTTDDTPSRVYDVSLSTILADTDYQYDCFLYDTGLRLVFSDLIAEHTKLRVALVWLNVIRLNLATAEQIDKLSCGPLKTEERLADIYIGLCYGFYESGGWGGRRVICSEHYPFIESGHVSLKDVANLSLIPYTNNDALSDLNDILAGKI